MANRWEKFNGVSSKLLDMLDDMNDKVKVKLDKAEGDDKAIAEILKDFDDDVEDLADGLAAVEKDTAFHKILTDTEKGKLEKILKNDKDFTTEEKLMLMVLGAIPMNLQNIGDVLHISKPGISKILKRATTKIMDIQKLEGKAFVDAMKREKYNREVAMRDGRYAHKGNQQGMERPGGDAEAIAKQKATNAAKREGAA